MVEAGRAIGHAGRSFLESEGFGQYQPQGQGNQNRHQYTQCHALVCDAALRLTFDTQDQNATQRMTERHGRDHREFHDQPAGEGAVTQEQCRAGPNGQ